MDKYFNEYKNAVNSIKAESDIAQRAISKTANVDRFFIIKRAAIAACAVFAMSGTVAYAVNTGWINNLFGTTSSEIESNASDYFVKTSDFTITSESGNFPYDFTFGDVLSDGQMIYGMMNIKSKNGEPVTMYSMPVDLRKYSRNNTDEKYECGFVYLNENEDGSMEGAFYIVPENEFSAGDKIDIGFAEYDVTEDNDTVSEIAFSFEMNELPETLSQTIEVNKPTQFTSFDNKTATATIENIEISPFRFSINGNCNNENSFNVLSQSPDYSINFTDGSRLYAKHRGCWDIDTTNSNGESVIKLNEFAYTSFGFGGTVTSDGFDFEGETSFRCVLPVDKIVSITVGDIDIPVK